MVLPFLRPHSVPEELTVLAFHGIPENWYTARHGY